MIDAGPNRPCALFYATYAAVSGPDHSSALSAAVASAGVLERLQRLACWRGKLIACSANQDRLAGIVPAKERRRIAMTGHEGRCTVPFTAGQPVQSIHPRYLSVYASTRLLPDTLQHSIPGLWLAVTRAGFPPACQQTISSPHVQRLVRP